MNKFWFQTKINLTRLIKRDIKTVFLALFFPIFFYVLYTKVFVFEMAEAEMVIWQKDYMLSMIIFGSMFTMIITLANTLLEDYTNQFQLFVHLTPTSKWFYYLSINLVYIPINLMLTLALGLIAYFVNGVTLGIIEWVVLLLIILFGILPFSLLGIMISYGRKTTIVNILGNLTVFPLAIIGGLWWPLEMMPSWIVSIGEQLMTNKILVLSRDWVHSNQFNLPAFFGLILWILGLVVAMIGVQKLFKYKESDIV